MGHLARGLASPHRLHPRRLLARRLLARRFIRRRLDARRAAGPAHRAPQDVLRDRLIAELQEKDPGVALSGLQRAVARKPALARHCTSIARALGKAAVHKYGPQRAQRFSRPVCDTSFAYGVAQLS